MKLAIVCAALVVTSLVSSASAWAYDQPYIPFTPGNPATNGCPSGWEALRVADLTPLGYGLPSRIDAMANGGNGDHIVCGKPFSNGEEAARAAGETVPIVFDFRDNSLNALTVQEP